MKSMSMRGRGIAGAAAMLLAIAACQAPTAAVAPAAGTAAPPASTPPPAVGIAARQGRTPAPSQAYAGWYLQHAGEARFQPCGSDAPWTVGQGAELAARARDFGLLDDTPVYVRVTGVLRAGVLHVRSVEQFGSPAPVRDCAMTGVVIQR